MQDGGTPGWRSVSGGRRGRGDLAFKLAKMVPEAIGDRAVPVSAPCFMTPNDQSAVHHDW